MRKTTVEGIGEITIKKSRRAKRLILRIDHEGQPVVTIPSYVPYAIGERYARAHQGWLQEHGNAQPKVAFLPGAQFGQHTLQFQISEKPNVTSRVSQSQIVVSHPADVMVSDSQVQTVAKRAVTRAIKRQAEDVLPHMLYQIAQQYGYSYDSVSVKNMRSRWGSCSSQGTIALNIWLVQLPMRLQRYVLCHELTHLHHPHHQPAFWQELELMVPDYKQLRKELRTYQPSISFTP